MKPPLFECLHHADWSMHPGKRWTASALFEGARWRISGPHLVGDTDRFLDRLLVEARSRHTLAGFDFPIGVPAAYGVLMPFSGFRTALPAFGDDPAWSGFFDVAETPDEISLTRPFYPRRSAKGAKRSSLVTQLGVGCFDDLLRVCERGSNEQRAACSVFWTLGGNQVGKGALAGWREIVHPALMRNAALWPYDGSLEVLARQPGLVLAETYPAIAYRTIGCGFGPGQSKRRQRDRMARAPAILRWADEMNVDLGERVVALHNGFGDRRDGEDAFDALVGLLQMILVVGGTLPEASMALPVRTARWEGWILGR